MIAFHFKNIGSVRLPEGSNQSKDKEISLKQLGSAINRVTSAIKTGEKQQRNHVVKMVVLLSKFESHFNPHGGGQLFLKRPQGKPTPIEDFLLERLSTPKKPEVGTEPTEEVRCSVSDSCSNDDSNQECLGDRKYYGNGAIEF